MAKSKQRAITAQQTRDGWIDGTIGGLRFQAKVYDEGSAFGINGGRVSKLMIWDEQKRQGQKNIFRASIVNFDRGWDIEPQSDAERSILDTLLEYLEKLPTAEYWEGLTESEPVKATIKLKDGHLVNGQITIRRGGRGTIQDCLTGCCYGKLDPIAVRDFLERKNSGKSKTIKL